MKNLKEIIRDVEQEERRKIKKDKRNAEKLLDQLLVFVSKNYPFFNVIRTVERFSDLSVSSSQVFQGADAIFGYLNSMTRFNQLTANWQKESQILKAILQEKANNKDDAKERLQNLAWIYWKLTVTSFLIVHDIVLGVIFHPMTLQILIAVCPPAAAVMAQLKLAKQILSLIQTCLSTTRLLETNAEAIFDLPSLSQKLSKPQNIAQWVEVFYNVLKALFFLAVAAVVLASFIQPGVLPAALLLGIIVSCWRSADFLFFRFIKPVLFTESAKKSPTAEQPEKDHIPEGTNTPVDRNTVNHPHDIQRESVESQQSDVSKPTHFNPNPSAQPGGA